MAAKNVGCTYLNWLDDDDADLAYIRRRSGLGRAPGVFIGACLTGAFQPPLLTLPSRPVHGSRRLGGLGHPSPT